MPEVPLPAQTPAPRELRWAGHSHVCRTAGNTARPLEVHRDALRDQGLHYFGFGHPWEPWDLELAREWEGNPEKVRAYRAEEIWRTADPSRWLRPARFARWRESLSTPDFLFEIDQETPKVRFGHLWWIGWQPELAPWHDYDAGFDHWQVKRDGPRPAYRCRMIPEAIRAQRALGAMPVYAHPTSWWTHGGNHVTNISATLVPDILTRQAGGCLVVMGYDANHPHYQDLWFQLLNRGVFITGVAETDASLDGRERFERALFHNAAPAAEFSTRGLQDALALGHNVMTTGPGLRVRCGAAGPGDFVPAGGGRISVHASRLERSHEYQLSVIFNGTVVREQRFGGLLEWEETFAHDGPGWVVVKIVNTTAKNSAAIANPLFFKNEPHRVTGHPLPEATVRYWEKPGAMDLLHYLADGAWRTDFPGCNPGEMPWEAFRWDAWSELFAAPDSPEGNPKHVF